MIATLAIIGRLLITRTTCHDCHADQIGRLLMTRTTFEYTLSTLMLILTLARAAARPAGRASMAGSDFGRTMGATRCM